MDFSKENNRIRKKNDFDGETKLSNELINIYGIEICEETYKTSYQYGLKLSGSTYENLLKEIPVDNPTLVLNILFIQNFTKSIWTNEIHTLFKTLNNEFDIDYFFFMNCKTGINFKNLDIKNKIAFNKIPYEDIRYTDETPDIKKGDLDMKIDKKYKNKNLVYVINLSDIIYIDNDVYKKIIKGLKENIEYKYVLIIENIYIKYTETYEQDCINCSNFYKLLALIQFSLKRIHNKKMFNLENINNKTYFDSIKNLYPYGNFQHQLLFERKTDNSIVKLPPTVLNKISNIVKTTTEFIYYIQHYELFTDFHLKNTQFIINTIINNLDYIIKTKLTFPILNIFRRIQFKDFKEYILILLFIQKSKDDIYYEKHSTFIKQTTLYTNFTVKYSLLEQMHILIKGDKDDKGKKNTSTLLTKLYYEFVDNQCDMCVINKGKYRCKCGKLYCSKECQKIDWKKNLFNHKQYCDKCYLCGKNKHNVFCKCDRKFCNKECLSSDLIQYPHYHNEDCF